VSGRQCRRSAHWRVLAYVTLGLACCLHACEETRRGAGEECLRNEDCLSNSCSGRSCANEGPKTGQRENTTTLTTEAGSADAGDGG
jgi:hypothetical protein